MAIITDNTQKGYVMVARDMLTDNRLSWGARGFMSYLMTVSNIPDEIEQKSSINAEYNQWIAELIDCGYLEVIQL